MVCHHNSSNSYCLSSLEYEFTVSGENKYARAIVIRNEESLHCQSNGYKDRIVFANAIMSDQERKTGEQRLHYNIHK